MTPEQFKRAGELFLDATGVAVEDRSGYVVQACGGDEVVRREVESLLAHDALVSAGGAPTVVTRPDAAVSSRRLPVPVAIPDYELLRPIGRGGVGTVWLARNRLGAHHCAVKVFAASAAAELAGLREYKRRAADHPALVRIEHVGQVGDLCYSVMPLADDATATSPVIDVNHYEPRTLARRVAREGGLPLAEVIAVARSIIGAIDHLHRHGAVHADVKPANIVSVRGRWQLGDHGLVTALEAAGTRGWTPAYCPPEGPGGASGDLYALGATLFEIATGEAPELVADFAAGRAALPSSEAGSEPLAAIIRRVCAPDPTRRFRHARDLRRAVDAIGCGGESGANGRSRLAFLAATVLVAAVVITLGVPLRGGGEPTSPSPSPSGEAGSVAPVRIAVLRVRRFSEQQQNLLGEIGLGSDHAFANERVGVDVQLNRAAYCFVVAFSPDGSEALCYPASADERPVAVDRLTAPLIPPEREPGHFALTEGVGTQAFIVLAASSPLPSWSAWRARADGVDWRPPETTVPWVYDGARLIRRGADRGPVRASADAPGVLRRVCEALRSAGGIDGVRGVAFPVVDP